MPRFTNEKTETQSLSNLPDATYLGVKIWTWSGSKEDAFH